MWISTKLGVDRFDGKNFRHYPLNLFPDQGYNRIGVNYLRCSPDSTLWVFSEAGLLFQYDERKDEFELIYAVRDFFNNHSIILNDVDNFSNSYELEFDFNNRNVKDDDLTIVPIGNFSPLLK